MRTTFNRQTRRAALCIGARRPHDSVLTPPRGGHLAQVAARIAAELELSAEAIDDLLWGSTSRPRH